MSDSGKCANDRGTRTEWHNLVIWNGLGRWAATLPKGTSLFVEGELVYEEFPCKVETTIGTKTVEVEVRTRVAKMRVDRMLCLEPGGEPKGEGADSDA